LNIFEKGDRKSARSLNINIITTFIAFISFKRFLLISYLFGGNKPLICVNMSKPPPTKFVNDNHSTNTIHSFPSKPITLSDIQATNRKRWETLTNLHEQLSQLSKNTHPNIKSFSTVASQEKSYVAAERDLLSRPTCTNTREYNSIYEGILDKQHRSLQHFGNELSSTYTGLKQMNAVLQERFTEFQPIAPIPHLQQDSTSMKEIMNHHLVLYQALRSLLVQQQSDEENSSHKCLQDETQQEIQQVKEQSMKKKSLEAEIQQDTHYQEWIQQELSYLAKIIESQQPKRPSSPIIFTGPLTKKAKMIEPSLVSIDDSSTTTTSSSSDPIPWNIPQILNSLIYKQLSSPMDSYMEFHPDRISKPMIDFLVASEIVEYHPQHPKLFRLKKLQS